MEITSQQFKRCDLVHAKGRIDSQTAPELKDVFNGITEDGRYRIVFDMSEVEFISSVGIWVLLDTQKTCKRYNRGDLFIANVNDKIKYTLDLAGLIHFFQIFDDVVEAVGSC
jgi:anti-sigma B factor antagonist